MKKPRIPLNVRKHPLVSTVRDAIMEQDVVIAISGGVDSTALLLLACAGALQQSASFNVVSAHVHHGLRKESDEEQRLVQSLCDALGVECVCKQIQVEPHQGSLAAGARIGRYDALLEIASNRNIKQVATAHHATDQLETMLMAICRGSGLQKLAGMKSSRPLSPQVQLIRPLLHAQKSDLERICRDCDVQWCEDPTNQDVTTPRGLLRKEVLPDLREIWPAADKHAANASTLLQSAIDSFEKKIPDGTSWEREELSTFPHAVVAEVVHRAVGDNATFETVQSIANAVKDPVTDPRTFTCSNGFVATVTAHQVEFLQT